MKNTCSLLLNMQLLFVLASLQVSVCAQIGLPGIPVPGAELRPDTLYLPFNEDGLQLVVINSSDTWIMTGSRYDAAFPRGGSWFLDYGPGPDNCYFWRDNSGKVTRHFNCTPDSLLQLRPAKYVNHSFSDIGMYVHDYNAFYGHFKFRGTDFKWGLINRKGEIVVPAEFDEIRRFQNDPGSKPRIIVQNGKTFGLLDEQLHEVVPPVYTLKEGYPEHSVINGKYLAVMKDKRYGLITEDGEVKIDFNFDEIRLIHDSMYIGLIYKDAAELKSYNYLNYLDWGYRAKACVVFDKNFRRVMELADYEFIYYWGIKQFIVKKNGFFGVLNTNGEKIIPLEYDALSGYNGHYIVRKKNDSGIFSTEGKLLLPIEFQQIQAYGKAVYVTKNKLIGVYNNQFQLIAEPQYQYRHWDMGKFILTRPDGSEGFVEHSSTVPAYYQSPEGEKRNL